MRVLITGHDGYIGAVMIPYLRAAGHELVGLDNHMYEGCSLGAYEAPIPSLRLDVRDVTSKDLRDFDAVVHLAAISNDPLGDLNAQCTYDINHLASVRLAELAKEVGVRRFLYSSSCSVYGSSSADDILDETATFSPITAYAKSKVMVEGDLSKLADGSFSPTYLRNATVYGASPRLRGDLVVNNLAGWAFTTGQVHLKSDGTPWRPLVHVEDVCRAFAAVLDAPIETIHDQAFNVGRADENYRISEVASIVQAAIPGSEITFADGAGPDPRCYRVSFNKIAKSLPDFKPEWDVRRGVAELLDSYRREGLTREQLEGDRFIRLQTIMRLIREGRLNDDLHWVER